MYRRLLLFAVTAIGVTSVVTQTLFIRELVQIFYGNELCIGVIFAGWLFFTGLGSIIGRRVTKNVFPELLAALSLIMPIEFFLVHSIKPILRVGPGEMISPIPMITINFVILAPLSIVLGLLFVQGCKRWAELTKSEVQGVSRVYILDAVGYMIGGFIFTYLLIRFFSLNTLFVIGLLTLSISFPLTFVAQSRNKQVIRGVMVFLGILSILGLSLSPWIEKFTMTRNYPKYEVVNHKRSIYGNLVVTKLGSLYSLYEDGMLSFSYQVPIAAEEKVHFTLLQVENHSRILLLGGNTEIVSEILKYPIQELHWVKLDPKLVEVCEPFIDFSVLNDTRVKINWEDGRQFVKRYKGEKFDAIIIDIGEPHTSLLNRFYTIEFFNELAEILHPAGVVGIEISSNPNYLSEELKEYNGIIYKTLKKVFPYIVIVPGESMQLLGCRELNYLSDAPDILSARISVSTQYVTEYYIPYKFYRERIAYIRGVLESFTPRILNTDFHPVSYYYDIVIKGAYFSMWFRKIFVTLAKIPAWLTLLTLTLVFILIAVLTRPVVLSIGIIGATGIGSQLLLILSFEVLCGYVYHKIGIITAGFMVGVALGAKFSEEKREKLSPVISGMILYLGLLFLIIRYLATSHLSTNIFHLFEPAFYLLPMIGGILTGATWTLANRHLIGQRESVERSSGLLYGIDLFGSCAGSFFVSVFLVPIYGLNFVFLLLAVLNLVAVTSLLMIRA